MKDTEIVTTDFFAFDDTSDTFGLEGLGLAVEMGDAVLGMVVQQMGARAPKWAAVRNASDPQIDSTGLTKKEAATKAGQIYERFGYWTTIPSAITCWGIHRRQLTDRPPRQGWPGSWSGCSAPLGRLSELDRYLENSEIVQVLVVGGRAGQFQPDRILAARNAPAGIGIATLSDAILLVLI